MLTRQAMTFRLPRDVVKAARARAKKDRVAVTTVVEAALRVYLDAYPSYVARGRKGGRP